MGSIAHMRDISNSVTDNVTTHTNIIIDDSGRMIVPIRCAAFLGAIEATVESLLALHEQEIANMIGVPEKYAAVLKKELLEKFLGWYDLITPELELFSGVYPAEGVKFMVTGVMFGSALEGKSKRAMLANILPIGRASIHYVSDTSLVFGIDGGNKWPKRLFQLDGTTGPIIFIRSRAAESYQDRRALYEVSRDRALKNVKKYLIRPTSDGSSVQPMTVTSYYSSPLDYYQENLGVAVETARGVLKDTVGAILAISVSHNVKEKHLLGFASGIASLCKDFGVRHVFIDNADIYEAIRDIGESESLGILLMLASPDVGAFRELCSSVGCGLTIKKHTSVKWLITKDTTAKEVAASISEAGHGHTRILVPTNHAYKSGPVITFTHDDIMVISIKNPGVGTMFRTATANRGISAGTIVVTTDVNPRSVFAKKIDLVI